VLDLKHLSQQIRQSAEDNAHSFKTPLAAIQSSLSPVRRAVGLEELRARRALEIIDSSLARLLALVNAAQRFDNSTADLIEAPRVPTNLTQLVGEATLNFREIMASRDIHLIRRLDDGVVVRSAKGMLETALQNILENAISFSPRTGTITVTLSQDHDTVQLQVDDEGPRHPARQDRAHLRALLLLPSQPAERARPPAAFRPRPLDGAAQRRGAGRRAARLQPQQRRPHDRDPAAAW
jgi:two-component system sensor histidine kinase ChvG